MATAPMSQPVSSLSPAMAAHIQSNIDSILGNPHDPNPGQTLQHFVSKFQDDPSHYTPVLAMATATQSHLATQKQLQAQPQQPPVAQQAFAKLGQPAQQPQVQHNEPMGSANGNESAGISQLPAGNIEGMAGGGITGMPSFSGSASSYVDPAQQSMIANISPDQALNAGYANPLSSYGANDVGGTIEGIPLRKGGRVEDGVRRFDTGGVLTPEEMQQVSATYNPYINSIRNANGVGQTIGAGLHALVGVPSTLIGQGLSATGQQISSGLGEVGKGWNGGALPQQPAPASSGPWDPNVSLNSVMNQGPIRAASFMPAQDAAPKIGVQPQQAPQQGQDIAHISPNFTPGGAAVGGVASLAKSLGFDPNMTLASANAQWEKDHTNPINAQQLELGYQTKQIKDAMLANGVDPDQVKQFQTIQDRQDASDAMLDKKQNLSIMAAGLGMIRSGNPWEAIAAGAQQGVKSYGDALDSYQQQQQHLADARMALEQSKQSLNAGMVDKAMGQVDQATKYQFDYNKNSADNVRSIFENNRTGLSRLAETQMQTGNQIAVAQIHAGAQKYASDQMFGARMGVAEQNNATKGANAAINSQVQQAKLMMSNPDPSVQQQGLMMLHRLQTPGFAQPPAGAATLSLMPQ
jgi:hypothetical protein